MSSVNILAIDLVGRNPTSCLEPFQFQIDFECAQQLNDDLEWKVIYIGSAESEQHDQVLCSVLVGPIPVGKNRFILEADAPDTSKIPARDAIGVTALMVVCSYVNQEFVRVGYYINNDYSNPELRLNPPKTPLWDQIERNLLIGEPRVTRFVINWDAVPSEQPYPGPNTGFPEVPYDVAMESSQSMDVVDMEQSEVPRTVLYGNGIDFTTVLSTELSKLIFRYLMIFDLGRCRRASKSWYHLISEGVSWEAIALTADDWEGLEDPGQINDMTRFLIQQSSPALQELYLPDAPIKDEHLAAWLNKCGASLKVIDINNCCNLSSKQVIFEGILPRCPLMEDLRIAYVGNIDGYEPDEVTQLCQHYSGTLHSLSINGLSDDILAIIAQILSRNLQSIQMPHSDVTDLGIQALISNCPNVRNLGLDWCDVTKECIQRLRSAGYNVTSTIDPTDFIVELTPEIGYTIVSYKAKTWPLNELSSFDVSTMAKNIPNLPQLEFDNGCMFFEDSVDDARNMYEELGFVDIQEKQASEEEDELDEEDICEFCHKTTDEVNLITCEECERSWHIYCLKPPLQEVPVNSWYCSQCEEDPHTRKRRKI